MSAVSAEKPTYVVKRLAGHRWELLSPFGTRLGIHKSRQAAVTVGRALAGWRGAVCLGKGC